MDWIRLHPYATTLALAGLLVVAGAVVVEQRSPASVSNSTITWSGGTPNVAYLSGGLQSQTPQSIPQEIIQNQSPQNVALPLVSTTPAPTAPAPASPSGAFNYAALIAQLSASSQKPSTPANSNANSSSQLLTEAYAFVPTGLIATTTPAKAPMSATQQALYAYGNEVGSTIQSFEAEHPGEAQILKDQAQDRTDPAKANALFALGEALAAVGTNMEQTDDVPDSVASLHTALAKSYEDIGAKLELVAQTQSDANFVAAIQTYDASADTFTKNYVALAEYFSAQGVVFSPQDPGSEFSFTESSGL